MHYIGVIVIHHLLTGIQSQGIYSISLRSLRNPGLVLYLFILGSISAIWWYLILGGRITQNDQTWTSISTHVDDLS